MQMYSVKGAHKHPSPRFCVLCFIIVNFHLQEMLLPPRLHSHKSIIHDNMLNQLLVTLG